METNDNSILVVITLYIADYISFFFISLQMFCIDILISDVPLDIDETVFTV